MLTIITDLPINERSRVIPVDKPTVPKAEISSNNKSLHFLSASEISKMTVPTVIMISE